MADMRGFLGGVSVGALVAVGGAGLVSLAAPLPQTVEQGALRAPQDPGLLEPGAPPAAEATRDADLVEAAPVAPQEGDAQTSDTLPELETNADTQPEVSRDSAVAQDLDLPTDLSAPKIADQSGEASDAPHVAMDSAPLPTQPESESLPDVATQSAEEPILPTVNAQDDVIAGLSTAPAATSEPTAPRLPTTAQAASPKSQLPVVPSPQAEANVETGLPDTIAEPAPAPLLEQVPIAEAPELETPDSTEGEVRFANLPQAGNTEDDSTSGPSIGTRVLPLTERGSGNQAGTQQIASLDGSTDGPTSDMSPFDAYSVEIDVSPDLPYMSIVLIEGASSIGAQALEDFPYPLTFAIDPSAPDAVQRMAERRAAGFEVMVLADLPRAATPQDAETAMPVWLDTLPKAMGILEGVETGVQGNRELADQVATLAKDLGYGLVLQDNGLNTVQKLAKREGVPSGVVFRDFDGAGQNPRAIRRFLDQAAFRAGQEGAVIMLGRLKPDTISALLLWGLQDRASRVSLVPASSSLRLLQER